jgi:hypothetical protein
MGVKALAKPPSSVLQAQYSEARIQYSEMEPSQATCSIEALAKPPSSVLQAPYSEARIQYSEL